MMKKDNLIAKRIALNLRKKTTKAWVDMPPAHIQEVEMSQEQQQTQNQQQQVVHALATVSDASAVNPQATHPIQLKRNLEQVVAMSLQRAVAEKTHNNIVQGVRVQAIPSVKDDGGFSVKIVCPVLTYDEVADVVTNITTLEGVEITQQ